MDTRRPNVLFIDDIETQRMLYVLIGKRLGFDAVATDSCQDALNEIERCQFDMIMIDWVMPKDDGVSCAKRIRATCNEKGRQAPPIVCVTARAMPGDREQCLSSGFDDYLSKPFTLQMMSNLLNKWVTYEPV